MGSTLGCGRQGTYRVRVRVGSLVVHDLPVPGLRVFDVVPIPVRVTHEYSHTFTHTVIQNILECYNKKKVMLVSSSILVIVTQDWAGGW